MIKILLFDFARVILFPKDVSYSGTLSDFYRKITQQKKSIFDYYKLNEDLLAELEKYKPDFQLAILTSSEHLPFHPEILPMLKKTFEPIIFSGELEFPKYQPGCYQEAIKLLAVAPQEVIFVDDSHSNIEAATEVGLHTVHFLDNRGAFEKIDTILQNSNT